MREIFIYIIAVIGIGLTAYDIGYHAGLDKGIRCNCKTAPANHSAQETSSAN
jgi:hypothetical protein